MPGPLVVNRSLTVPEAELSWRFSRSSGPGGQSVNTTDSRAELSFDVERAPSLSDSLRSRALARLSGRRGAGRRRRSPGCCPIRSTAPTATPR